MKKALAAGLLTSVLLLSCLTGCGGGPTDAPSGTPSIQPTQVVQTTPIQTQSTPAAPTPTPSPSPTATPAEYPKTVLSGSSVASAAPAAPAPTVASQAVTQGDYILNTNTKKFHKPSCSSVDQMKESNKQTFTGTRDEVIARGYSPCGRCHP